MLKTAKPRKNIYHQVHRKAMEKTIEVLVKTRHTDEITIQMVAVHLRIISDEINREYTKMSPGNILIWRRIFEILGKYTSTVKSVL